MSSIKVQRATPEKLRELEVESWSPWECEPETFDWEYSSDETAYVKEGRVKVRTDQGEQVEFGAGDLVFFPRGLRCTWTVVERIRKVYVFNKPL